MVSEEEKYIWLQSQEDKAKIYWEDKHIKQFILDKAICTARWIKGGMHLHSYWLGGRKTPKVYFICTEVIEVSYAHSLKVAQEQSLERWGKRQPYSTEIFSNPWKESWKWMQQTPTSLQSPRTSQLHLVLVLFKIYALNIISNFNLFFKIN